MKDPARQFWAAAHAACLLSAIAILLGVPRAAWAAPGDLDQAFGSGGTMRLGFGGGYDYARAVAVLPDGRIVLAGYGSAASGNDIVLTRYHADGTLDLGFGVGGKVTTQIGTSHDEAYALLVQTDGKLVVAGQIWNGTATDIALARYLPDGKLDPGFGSGGNVITPVSAGGGGAYAALLQPDGKIVVAGYSLNGGWVAVRYDASGALDAGFGSGGMVLTPIGTGYGEARSLALQEDGKIVAAGWAPNGTNNDFAVVLYNADGSLDADFGAGGKLMTEVGGGHDVGFALALQPDGRIVVAGYSLGAASFDFALVRYNADGSLDSAFGAGGKVVTPLGEDQDTAHAIRLQPDGRILVAGSARVGADLFALARYNADGSLDSEFGGGIVVTQITASASSVYALALQPDGKILAAGNAYTGAATSYDLALVRYDSSGGLDPSFGTGGMVLTDAGDLQAVARAVVRQPDGKIIVAGEAGGGGFSLVRLEVDGTLDTGFGTAGKVTAAFEGGEFGNAVALQPDGKIVVAGSSVPPSDGVRRFTLARYESNGTLDASFASGGVMATYSGSAVAVAVQPDGKIVAAGNGSTGTLPFTLMRVTSSGAPDPAFGSEGIAPNAGIGITATALALQADGKIVVAGQGDCCLGAADFVVARYDSNGSIDTTFSEGRATIPMGSGDDIIRALAVQPDGKILLAGESDQGFAVARLDPDGLLDAGFGTDGKVLTAVGTGAQARAIALQRNGKITVAGMAAGDFAVVRYHADGSLDSSFGAGGIVTTAAAGTDFALALAVQADGKILAAGRSGGLFGLARYAGDALIAADFASDGRSDILWRNGVTGENYLYPMNGREILATEGYLRTVPDPAWQIVGVGDFDGDGKADILWRNSSTGENYLYFMDGTTIKPTEGYIRTIADQNWVVAGTGDFNADGKDDILWRNIATGENYLYPMDGRAILSGEGYLRTVADHHWQMVGVGDFDGDGKADILWRNTATGENYIYLMNGIAIAGEGYLRTVADQSWQVAGMGDFDGDGKDDVLWRNLATGENYLYPMSGTTILVSEGYLRTVPDQNWRVAGVGDYDGDGKSDVLWRNAASGENYVYLMDGTTIKPAEGYLRTVADQNWQPQRSSGFAVRRGTLDGMQGAAPSGSSATGTTLVRMDLMSRALLGRIDTSGLSSPATMAHIHLGARGVDGGIAVFFDPQGPNAWVTVPNAIMPAGNYLDFLDGTTYVNVHTNNFPNGEIRGQLE